ncbi:flagellar motor switch phosphatase FliY [Clostridium formicaceticum]|uniref:Flagellar motor switch phosphatase FliY n=1 Tax=Clostridium formicaceticum TaxID=1497 RepID=A0AAC9RKU0_9CLOT|nr:flagellar motor switch phosphatase FliY [Clostridium formicaceticum]AOY77308.1 flagellar motor switch phosphatase FliY [Clostridium formicaceticum]ARE87851.1 Flagellar motor switch protein FliN [Clostridium formicaceticum]
MSDMLSQEEIDALLSGSDINTVDSMKEAIDEFTDIEKDAIGEIGNISMGTAATTLSTLLGHKVGITTPKVSVITMEELSEQYTIPFVAVDVRYKEGIRGTNLLIIKVDDVKIITDLMMGGSGTVTEDPLSELHLSAISEAMNQMVGSSSTSLSEMFSKKIDIHPPRAFELDFQSNDINGILSDQQESVIKIAFKMEIEGLIDSEIMQLIPMDFAKEMVSILMPAGNATDIQESVAVPEPYYDAPNSQNLEMKSNQETPSMPLNSEKHQESTRPQHNTKINVQPVTFQSFDEGSQKGIPENIALIQDVPLQVTVELGRTTKRINEVLEFGPGTIIELDKLVGEPLDILVNGQYVAKGEVVVIDENYGIRITDIVHANRRFEKI